MPWFLRLTLALSPVLYAIVAFIVAGVPDLPSRPDVAKVLAFVFPVLFVAQIWFAPKASNLRGASACVGAIYGFALALLGHWPFWSLIYGVPSLLLILLWA